jgi:hypothetical protein
MVRQAQTYLTGAVSATALVAAAVVAFVLLVSFQALKDWPLAALGGGDEASLSPARPVDAGGPSSSATGGAGSARADAAAQGHGSEGAGAVERGENGTLGAAPGEAPVGAPTTQSPGGGGDSDGSAASGSNGAGSGSQAGGGSGTGSGSGQSTSGAVTGAVNDTVAGVDEAVGGALGETGVTEVTEGAVNGVAGPESPVGETVDKVAGTVGSVLGGD